MVDAPIISRRQFLGGVAGLVGAAAVSSPALASISKKPVSFKAKPARFLAFDNLHTGEQIKITYWEKGGYIKGALKEINHILRDHRNNAVHRIDTALLDQLFVLRNKLNARKPFQVISGYRSPASNAMLRSNSDGVAKKSMHLEGRAIDIRIENIDLSNIHHAALAMKAGGVGYYPSSEFVHIDTGKVRHWG